VSARFFVDIDTPTIELGIHDIWPDGDAPDNPTVQDVVAVMRRCGSRSQVLSDWCLDAELRITVTEPFGPYAQVWP
jgi:hypothetical protein